MASTHVSLVTAGGTSNRRIASSLYGYCQTGASTVAKTVSLYTGNDNSTTDGSWASGDLFHGLTITVRFRYSNTATNPTLNVNSTGAKRIYKYGTTSPGTTASTSWEANSVISLTYDTLLNSSGCWVMNDHLDDTTGGSGSIMYTLSGSGDDDEYTITATPTSGSPTSATIPAATTTDAGVMTADDKTKLTGIASGAEVNVQADWNESDTTSDAYIQNKPTIPTVNDGTLTVQKNGTTIDTFTANQSGNTTVDITVPTATSDLTNDSGFVTDVQVNGTSVVSNNVANVQDGDFMTATTRAAWDTRIGTTDATIDQMLAYIVDAMTVKSVTPTLTAASSAYHATSAVMYVYGKVVLLSFIAYCSSGQVAAGDNIYRGTLGNTAYRPKANTMTATYYNAKTMAAQLETGGTITVRNSSAGYLPQNAQVRITFTYLIN